LIVIVVPPETVPELGVTLLSQGAVTKLYPELTALDPLPLSITPVAGSMFVTTTSVAPTAWGGVVATIHGNCTPEPQSEALLVTNIVTASMPVPTGAGGPPKLTTAPYRKPVPEITMGVPPFIEPDEGEIALTLGCGGGSA